MYQSLPSNWCKLLMTIRFLVQGIVERICRDHASLLGGSNNFILNEPITHSKSTCNVNQMQSLVSIFLRDSTYFLSDAYL